jgi:hypothetical protein
MLIWADNSKIKVFIFILSLSQKSLYLSYLYHRSLYLYLIFITEVFIFILSLSQKSLFLSYLYHRDDVSRFHGILVRKDIEVNEH